MSKLCFFEPGRCRKNDPSAKYAVLPIPYERSTSYGKGTGSAPAAILQASEELELFDEELLQPLSIEVQTLTQPYLYADNEEASLDSIRQAATNAIADQKRFLMSLGGEHTITSPLVKAILAEHGDISVLHLDAHLDLRETYKGNPLSHACVMRRVMEMGVPITHVGTRSLCLEEYELVKKSGNRVFWGHSLAAAPDDGWMDEVLEQLRPQVYITIDGDCLDPSFMPGTGTPEPGGLSWRQVTGLLSKVCSARSVVAADLVEVVPVPGSVVSEYTAARLAAKLMTYHARAKG